MTAFYGSADDSVVGWAGYTHTEPVTRFGVIVGQQIVEDMVAILPGATCPWTPELAASYGARS